MDTTSSTELNIAKDDIKILLKQIKSVKEKIESNLTDAY